MGLRSRRAFSVASPVQMLEVASAYQALLVHVEKPINISLLHIPHADGSSLSQYGVVQFNDKEKSFATPPATVEQAFSEIPFSGPEDQAFKRRLFLDQNLALAVELSRVTGRALYVVHSDSYCSSGYVLFEAARALEGVIYGWEGDENLFEFGPGFVRGVQLPVEQTQYWKYASLGVNRHLGDTAPYEEFLDKFDYSTSAISRYRLMLQKELVKEVAPEDF